MDGKSALDGRDFNNYIQEYLISAGVAKLSKQAIYDINSSISAQLHSYISYEQTKPENINQSALLSAAAKTTDSSLFPPPVEKKTLTEKNMTFSSPTTYEQYYPKELLDLNYNHSIGMSRSLPTSSSLSGKNLTQPNLYNLSTANEPITTNDSQFAVAAVLAAAVVNKLRKWVFRKPEPKSEKTIETTSSSPKSPSKDRGGRS